MSAYRDQSQGVAFVYTSIYKLYVDSKKNGGSGIIQEPIDVMAFRPRDKNSSREGAFQKSQINLKSKAMEELETNLTKLRELHSRLQYMISEIQELVIPKTKKDSDEN